MILPLSSQIEMTANRFSPTFDCRLKQLRVVAASEIKHFARQL